MIWVKLLLFSRCVIDGVSVNNRRSLVLAVLLVLGWPLCVHANTVVDVGVLAPRGDARAVEDWTPTMRALDYAVPGYRFMVRPLTLAGVTQAVADGEVDFVLTNVGQFVQLGTPFALSWLATLRSRPDGSTREALGSVMLVRADSRYATPADLRGRPVVAVDPQAFGGYLLLKPRLREYGLRSRAFDLRFLGYPIDALLYQLRDGVVDAAIVPVCLLEQMAREGLLRAERFRALLEMPPVGGCLSSTPAYPDWSFAALPHVSEALAAAVARALLLSAGDGAAEWGAPISSAQVDIVYRRLDMHPLDEPLWQRMVTLLLTHWQYTAGVVLLALIGLLHHLWLQQQASRRARELRGAQHALRSRERELAAAQRLNVLGELASVLAHELNQPLAAIRNYAEGSSLRLAREQPEHALLPILARIEAQADRGAAVIAQCRQWLKQDTPPPEALTLSVLLDDVARLHDDRLRAAGIGLDVRVEPGDLQAAGNRLALEQVLGNLIANSVDAYQVVGRSGVIDISACDADGRIEIVVRDAAGGFAPEQLRQPVSPRQSSRPGGLGLGLLICQRLMKTQGGTMVIGNAEGGASIRLSLPRWSDT